MELTNKQIMRQDYVDNRIFQLIIDLNPSQTEINWDIEMIGEIRDSIQNWIIEKTQIDEMSFYPYIKNA
jgi:hypothetical protein